MGGICDGEDVPENNRYNNSFFDSSSFEVKSGAVQAASVALLREEKQDVVASGYPYEIEVVSLVTRTIEIIVALLALGVWFPVNIAVALIIRRGTPGPVLFFQDRLGIGADKFKFVKFRTLYVDAKERFPEFYDYRYSPRELSKLHAKVKDDPRVTPQGIWLRKSTLDEMPNFWCLLTGRMALVGPRPELPEMLPYYKGEMLKKFSVRPGITGLAQVSGRGELSFYDTVKCDVRYVENKGALLDLKIIVMTLFNVFLRNGAF